MSRSGIFVVVMLGGWAPQTLKRLEAQLDVESVHEGGGEVVAIVYNATKRQIEQAASPFGGFKIREIHDRLIRV